MRIQTKIISLIVTLIMGSGILSSMIITRMATASLEREFKEKGRIIASTSAELITNRIINYEILSARESLEKIVHESDIEFAYVVGFDGNLFAHSFEGGFPRALAKKMQKAGDIENALLERYQTEKGPILEVSYPLIKGMRARLHIGMKMTPVLNEIETVRNNIWVTRIGIALLGIFFGFVLSRRITSPLGKLAESMQAYGRGGMEKEIVPEGGGLEVAELTQIFNQMLRDRKQTEEALKEQKEHFRSMVESSPDCICQISLDGSFLDMNPSGCAINEIEGAGEVIGKNCTASIIENREAAEDAVRRAAGGETVSVRYKSVTGTGREVWWDSKVTPIRGTDNSVKSILRVSRDITDRVKMEEELLRSQKLESIAILAGGIAHDFNNLLTTILGNIDVARMSLNFEDDAYKRLLTAEKAIVRAKELTRHLLTFSKGGAPVKKTASIVELLKEASEFALTGSNIRCELSVPPDLRPVTIDTGQISQVISNLIINSVQAMPEGGTINLSAENINLAEGDRVPLPKGSYIKISVIDHGSGIPKEDLSRIFDPYFTTKVKGSGLGLASAYSIVRKHDGYITVESEVGVGSAFHIYLPASQKEAPKKENEKEVRATGNGRILLMDDDEMVRDTFKEMASYIGYRVDAANEGSEALELYKKAKEEGDPFDLVIMDLTVPGGMGGEEAVRRLLEIDPNAKAVVSSGYSGEGVMAEFKKYGFKAVIAKPYNLMDLSKTLQGVINRK